MALNKNDLKQIREVVREEVRDQINAEVPPIVKAIVGAEILPIKQKVDQIWNALNDDLVANLTMIEKLSKKIKELEARVKKLEVAK